MRCATVVNFPQGPLSSLCVLRVLARDSILGRNGFHADLVVGDKVIVEIKALAAIAPVHKKQLLTYLKLADKRLGLLINFNVALIKDGITRIVNGLEE